MKILKAGELFVLTEGEYDDYRIANVFRVNKTFEIKGNVTDYDDDGCVDKYSEAKYIQPLLDRGYLKRVVCKEVNTDGHITVKEIG